MSEGKPIPHSPQNIPQKNLSNLQQLESSTGTWERGRSNLNARSPEATSVLESKMQAIALETGGAHKAAVAGSSRGPLYPRTPREGYGFRPSSGANTPTKQREEFLDKNFNDDVRAALSGTGTTSESQPESVSDSVADAEGLGWPGE